MADLREYKAVVLDALNALRKKDADHCNDGKGWGWRLKSISKKKVTLRWGYIPDTDITIRAEDDDGELWLLGHMDDRYPTDYFDDDADDLFVSVGGHGWNNTSSIEKGLRIIIGNIGYITRTRY